MPPKKRTARPQAGPNPPLRDPRRQGMQAFATGNFDAAITYWSRVIPQDEQVTAALAEAYFRRGLTRADADSRMEDMHEAARQMPTEPRYQYHLGLALQRAGKTAEAIERYRELLTRHPNWPGVGMVLALAELSRNHAVDIATLPGSTAAVCAALQPVQAVLRGQPLPPPPPEQADNPLRMLWYGLSLIGKGDGSARPALSQSKPLHAPQTAAVGRFYEGVAAAQQGDRASALKLWQHVYAEHRQYAPALAGHNLIALLLERLQADLNSGVPEAAADLARWASQVNLQHPALPPLLVQVLDRSARHAAAQGDWQQAAMLWEDARRIVSNSSSMGSPRPLLHNLAMAYEALDEWIAAAEMWRAMLRTRPRKTKAAAAEEAAADPLAYTDAQWAWIRKRVITCYKRAGEPGEAVKVFRQAIKADPNDLDMRIQLADALLANNQEQACLNELHRIVEIDPQHIEAHLRLAELHDAGGHWIAAERSLRIVLEQQPEREDVRRQIARLMLSRGHHLHNYGMLEAARRIFEEGQQFAPNDYEFPLNLARIAVDEGDTATAAPLLEQALQLAPDHPQAYIFVIDCWAVADRIDEAQEVLARAERLLTPTPEFYIDLVRVLLMHSRPSSSLATPFGAPALPSDQLDGPWMTMATTALHKAIALRPDDARVRLQLAAELLPLNTEMALEQAAACVELDPTNAQGWMLLGILQGLHNRNREARTALREAAKLARQQGLHDLAAYAERLRSIVGPGFVLSLQMEMMNMSYGDDVDDEFF